MPTPYILIGDLEGLVPGDFLIQALDDDNDGVADPAVINLVLKQASEGVDAILEGKFTVPLENPLPAKVIDAARIFAAEILHQRRGKTPELNPFTGQAKQKRELLMKVAAGELQLSPVVEKAKASGAVIITGRARTASATDRMPV